MSWFLPRPLSASCPSSTEVSFLPWTLAPRAAPHLRGLRAGIRDTRWRWCSASLSRSRLAGLAPPAAPGPAPGRRTVRTPEPRCSCGGRTRFADRTEPGSGRQSVRLGSAWRPGPPRTSGRRQVTRPWSGAVSVGAERAWGPLVLAGRDRPGSAAPCPPRSARARGGKAGRG